uniref:Phosphatidic acid phosphatase type 2/haloperoxidase domain-containing protein n=1 Tax=Ananas comosus var. bracteatus TaxID=296719 RepID=A0A6V7PW30_ANACO|nr:unnamed protein product [Ananas comosus var. bracteatus]
MPTLRSSEALLPSPPIASPAKGKTDGKGSSIPNKKKRSRSHSADDGTPIKTQSPANGNGKVSNHKLLRSPKSPRKRLLNQFSEKPEWNPTGKILLLIHPFRVYPAQIEAVKEALHVATAPCNVVCRAEEQKRIFEFCKPLVINFRAYSKDQILKIIQQRLMVLGYDVFQPLALEFCAREHDSSEAEETSTQEQLAFATGRERRQIKPSQRYTYMVVYALSVVDEIVDVDELSTYTEATSNVDFDRWFSAALSSQSAEDERCMSHVLYSSTIGIIMSAIEVLEEELRDPLKQGQCNIVTFDHMDIALSKAFKSAVVDTIHSLPQHQQIILCAIVNLFRQFKKSATTIGEIPPSAVRLLAIIFYKVTCIKEKGGRRRRRRRGGGINLKNPLLEKMADILLGSHTIKSHGAKVARFHMYDWIILVLLAVIDGLLNIIEPFHRFVGKDMMTDLRYPMKSNTVPFWAVPIIAIILPFFIFSGIYFKKRNVYDLHNAILGLLFSVLITAVITDAIKDGVGRPRPDFFWRCFPDGKDLYDNSTTSVICHGEKSVIKEGHKSFPSGHSSWSFAGLGFLSWYLAGKITAFDRKGHIAKLCIVFLPLLVASLVAVSRVDDYWHHWQDVFAGGLLGLTVASFCYLQFFPSPFGADSFWPHAFTQQLAERRNNNSQVSSTVNAYSSRPQEMETVRASTEDHIGINI